MVLPRAVLKGYWSPVRRYAKGYYRRADAAFALARWRDAVRDFRAAAKLTPGDPDLRRKLAEAERELKRELFEAALSTGGWVGGGGGGAGPG